MDEILKCIHSNACFYVDSGGARLLSSFSSYLVSFRFLVYGILKSQQDTANKNDNQDSGVKIG